MEWVAEQGIGGKSRTIVASTDRGLGYDSEDDYSNDDSDSDDMDGDWEYKPVVSKARGGVRALLRVALLPAQETVVPICPQ